MKIVAALLLACVAAAVPWSSGYGAGGSDSSAGVIVAVDGPVSIHRDAARLDVREGFALQPGDSLVIRQGGRCEGFSPVGEAFDRMGPALVVFATAADENFRSRVSRWMAEQLAQWVGQSRSRPLITRSGRDWAAPQSVSEPIIPAADGVVRPHAPVLCWKTLSGVEQYTVTVAAEDGNETSSSVHGNELAVELVPGTYVWRVRPDVTGASMSSPWKSFRVLTADEEAQVDESIADLSDLMAGVVLLCAGLHQEAILRLDGAVADPKDRAAALVWRARALSEVGLYDQAYQDMLQAMNED